jgi:hypothetical protein
MDTNLIPLPASGRILVLVTSTSTLAALFDSAAQLALQGPLYVLDGGNAFQGYSLARALRRQVVDIAAPLQRVQLSRAFTCYQMAALLDQQDFAPHPILVLDFLSTFYDQGVRIADRRRLLYRCIRRLQILGRCAPVAVWIRQRTTIPEDALPFLDVVRSAAGQIWYPPDQPALPSLRQPGLFPAESPFMPSGTAVSTGSI